MPIIKYRIIGVIVAVGVAILIGTTDWWFYNNCCSQLPGPQGEQGIPGPQGQRGIQGEQGIPGAAAPSALCTWENTTYSTGAECNFTSGCWEVSGIDQYNTFMVCQADGTWVSRNAGAHGNCPRTCGL